LVVAQSSSEIPEGLMNNPVYKLLYLNLKDQKTSKMIFEVKKKLK
jgi:hypothetical protein